MPYILGVTGHRPHRLGGYSREINDRLIKLATSALEDYGPEKVITGMAQGWDQAVAQACIDLHIPFIAAVPFPGQHTPWPPAAQANYSFILKHAVEKVIVSDIYNGYAMNKRNRYIVDNSTVILPLYDGTGGGTKDCLDYAKRKGKRMLPNLWESWLELNERVH